MYIVRTGTVSKNRRTAARTMLSYKHRATFLFTAIHRLACLHVLNLLGSFVDDSNIK